MDIGADIVGLAFNVGGLLDCGMSATTRLVSFRMDIAVDIESALRWNRPPPILNHSYRTCDCGRSRMGFLPRQSGAKVIAFDGKFGLSQRLFCTTARNKSQLFNDYERFKWSLVCGKLLSRKSALDGNDDVLLTCVDSFLVTTGTRCISGPIAWTCQGK